jgi:hypothetical protein
MGDPTLRADPVPDIQRKGVKKMPTGMTAFGGGIPLVNLDEGSPIPLGFVLQLAEFLFEGGILGSSLKEVQKRTIQVPQGLLHRDRGHFIEPRSGDLLLEGSQRKTQVMGGQTLSSLVVGIGLLPQGPIVDIPAAAECLRQQIHCSSVG